MSATISVVIPLFNKEKHIARAIRSVLAQTYHDFELVVVDDGSTDKSADVVREFRDPRVRLVLKNNGGASSARNRGIEESGTDLVAFLDADDVYKPNFLEKVVELKALFPDAGAFATNYEIVNRYGGVKAAVKVRSANAVLLNTGTYFDMAKSVSPISSSAVAVKKEVFAKVGLFAEGVKLGEDLDMWIRILFSYPVAFEPCVGATYYRESDLRVFVKNLPLREPYFFKTIDSLCAKSILSERERDGVREFKNLFVLIYAMNQIWDSSVVNGRRALLKCNTRAFLLPKWYWIIVSFTPRWIYRTLRSSKMRLRSFATRSWPSRSRAIFTMPGEYSLEKNK